MGRHQNHIRVCIWAGVEPSGEDVAPQRRVCPKCQRTIHLPPGQVPACPGCGFGTRKGERAFDCKACGLMYRTPNPYDGCPHCAGRAVASRHDSSIDPSASLGDAVMEQLERGQTSRVRDCPDCGKSVSLRATQCPACGAPGPAWREPDTPRVSEDEKDENGGMGGLGWVIVIGLGILFVMGALDPILARYLGFAMYECTSYYEFGNVAGVECYGPWGWEFGRCPGCQAESEAARHAGAAILPWLGRWRGGGGPTGLAPAGPFRPGNSAKRLGCSTGRVRADLRFP